MTRSHWKPLNFMVRRKPVSRLRLGRQRVYHRASSIPKELVGRLVAIHNGNRYKRVVVTTEMLRHKFGEFSPTRLFARYKLKAWK